MRQLPILVAVALAAGGALPAAAQSDDAKTLQSEVRRLSERLEQLERHHQALEKGLASDSLSEHDPELVTRLKAVEFQTLSMQKQARQIESLEGITVGASLTGVLQSVNRQGSSSGLRETRANYRGDVSVTLPGGEMGDTEGKIFTHFRFGQGNGVALVPTYTSTPNTTAFQVGGVPADDSFGILAQAWYQLSMPLVGNGVKANAREHLRLTAGKIDPFVFFDQNANADDESAKFLNNAFVHNPLLDSGGDVGADAYGFAPGAIFQYANAAEKGSEWALSLGVFGTSGAQVDNGANFNGSLGGPLVIAQAETATRFNFLPGNVRLYGWSNGRGVGYDGTERRRAGVGVSADQKVDDYISVFARYGHQLKGQVRFDRAVTLGSEVGGSAWGRSADSFGVAFGGMRTSGSFRDDAPGLDADGDGQADFGYAAKGWEKQAELYYRFKVNSRFELTPDLQWIQRPAANVDAPTVKVVALRGKIGF
jgi:high affinity Mn2+ porin